MSRRRYFEEQRSGNGAIYHCVEIDIDHDNSFEVLDLMSKDESDTISPDKVNNVLNNYDGKSDLIQNADEDVDCMTYAQDTSLYSNDSFFVFV